MSSVRRVVSDHPIAAFLIMGYCVGVATALTPQLRETEIWFELPLFASLGSILGVGLASFLVTATADGRAGVRDLLRRCLRWRVPARWYAIALLPVPVATILIALAIYGTDVLESPPDGWPHVLGVVLGVFVLQLLLFQPSSTRASTRPSASSPAWSSPIPTRSGSSQSAASSFLAR